MKISTLTTRILVVASLVVSATALNGCQSAGTAQLQSANHDTVATTIKDHVTTKDQVRAAFGDPARIAYSGDNKEVWAYAFAHATPTATSFIPIVHLFSNGADIDKKLLVIKFDDKGVVDSFEFSQSQVKTRNGIAE